jgi:hypothetical protein
MLTFFRADTNLVRWDLTESAVDGPYCVSIQHAQGSIQESFSTRIAALLRLRELEDMLVAAPCEPAAADEANRTNRRPRD